MATLTATGRAAPAPRERQDEALVAHALRLLATADMAEPDTATRASDRLAAWRTRSAAHQTAHAEALRRWQALAGAAAGLREQWADPIAGLAFVSGGANRSTVRKSSTSRRSLLGLALAGVGLAGLAGGGAWWQWQVQQPVFAQSWRTNTAQLMRVVLPDAYTTAGSSAPTEITLSAQTTLRAALYRDRREIDLTEGEARFDVLHDATRPFIVRTRTGRVEVVGTAFTVSDRGGALTVAVERGHVRLLALPWPASGSATARDAAASGTTIDLRAGDAISVRDGQPPGPVQRVATAAVGAWRGGWLVFDDMPLVEALPAINAFRRAPLVLADAPTGRLRLTARFRAVDERGLLAALPAVLPVRIEPRADGSLAVGERLR